jgi:hypothetical protein
MSDSNPDEQQLLARMKARVRADEAESQRFWAEVYPSLPLDERKQIWTRRILQQMRWQGESGVGDEFPTFTQANYRDWKARYADMDEILDHVIAQCDALHDGDGTLAATLNQRLGRR